LGIGALWQYRFYEVGDWDEEFGGVEEY